MKLLTLRSLLIMHPSHLLKTHLDLIEDKFNISNELKDKQVGMSLEISRLHKINMIDANLQLTSLALQARMTGNTDLLLKNYDEQGAGYPVTCSGCN